ncbi:MAG: hypothetical protein SGILL_002391 [Bacillariaceae sp.]
MPPRRITIELYKKVDERNYMLYSDRKIQEVLLEGFESSGDDVPSIVSIPPNSGKKGSKSKGSRFMLNDDDVLIFRIMKPVRAGSRDEHDGDDGSVATEYGGLDSQYMTTFALDNYGDGHDLENTRIKWKERYRATLQTMEILKTHSRTVDIQMGLLDDIIVRDFSFESIRDANTFVDIFNECRRLQRERGLRQAAAHGSGRIRVDSDDSQEKDKSRGLDLFNDDGDESQEPNQSKNPMFGFLTKKKKVLPNKLNILVEVVSASNLPIGGTRSKAGVSCRDVLLRLCF